MKRKFNFITSLIILLVFFTTNTFSQGFNYQAVARDNEGNVQANTTVNLRFTIFKGAPGATLVYKELFTPTTNSFGLINVVMGTGTVEDGDFNTIDWMADDFFLIVELDDEKVDTSQFNAVPYSKVATMMELDDLSDVNALSPSADQVLTWTGSEWEAMDLPASGGSESPWDDTSSDIFYNDGNVGIGDDTPSATLTVGDGDKFQVNGTDGDIELTDPQGTLRFPSISSGSAPMIEMFSGGTSNLTRMVIAHSATYPNWGLQYNDLQDAFTFLGNGVPALKIDLSDEQFIGVGTASPFYPLHVDGRGNEGGIRYDNNILSATEETDYYGIVSSITLEASAINRYVYAIQGIAQDADADYNYGVAGYASNAGTFSYGVYGYAPTSDGYAGYFNGNVFSSGSYLPSDIKLKTNVAEYQTGLDKIMALKPVSFDYQTENFASRNLPAGKRYGFVAQDVKQVLPELTLRTYQPALKADGKPAEGEGEWFEAVNYTGMIPLMVSAIQEQQESIKEKDARIDQLNSQVESMEHRITQLENLMRLTEK